MACPHLTPQVIGSTWQAMEHPNNSTYIGSGKVAEVARAMRAYKAETVSTV